MIEYQEIPGTNILELTLDDGFTKEDFAKVKDKITAMIAQHGKVRILEVVRKFGHLEPAAVWEDIKFTPRHMKYFSHAAIVADQKWIEWLTAAWKPFSSCELRVFPLAELEEARQWIRESQKSSAA